MTVPVRPIDPAGATTVLRGMVTRAQPVRLMGRPHVQTPAAVHEPQLAAAVIAPAADDGAAMAEARERAREQGYREGLEQGRQEGYDVGLREGTAAAKQEVLAQAADVIAEAAKAAGEQTGRTLEQEALQRWSQHKTRLDALLSALPTQIAQRMEAAQDDLLALCMETLLQILGREAVQAPVIRSAVRQALDQLQARPLVRIEIHPDDLTALQGLAGWDAWCAQQAPGAQWTANAQIVAGGCLVVSPEGSLDARLDSQLQTFRRLLLDSRRASSAPHEGARA